VTNAKSGALILFAGWQLSANNDSGREPVGQPAGWLRKMTMPTMQVVMVVVVMVEVCDADVSLCVCVCVRV